MIVQRTFLGGRRWTGPWRIRVDTMAGGTSNRTMTNYMNSGFSNNPILTDWGDGTRTVAKSIASHTYASDGDYIISHYSLDDFATAILLGGNHKNIVEVLDPFPRLPSVGGSFPWFATIFSGDSYLQTIPSNLFDSNADFITTLDNTFSSIQGGPLHLPAGLFKRLFKLSDISSTFYNSVLDHIPDGLFEGMTTIEDAQNTFENTKASYCGNRIFAGCTGLTSVTHCFFRANIPVFGDDTFNGCAKISSSNSYTFEGLRYTKSVGARTFANCTGITSCGYNFDYLSNDASPELESIGDYTWQNCTALERTSYFLSNAPKLKTLPSHTFSGCTKLKSIDSLFYSGGSALGAMDLYLESCPNFINSSAFKTVPDMTATTQRIIHVPSGCTITSRFPNKYTVVADN